MLWQPPEHLHYLLPDDVAWRTQVLAIECDAEVTAIAEGELRPWLRVLRLGHGPLQIAIVGNAHADEPAGTVAIMALAEDLALGGPLSALGEQATFHLLPTLNPLGLLRNRDWLLSPAPALGDYLRLARRDAPDQDREFGYGDQPDQAAHPECAAWHAYLDSLPRLDGYVSLHSMAFSGGALFLGGFDDIGRWLPLRVKLSEDVIYRLAKPLHDEDRGGRKGFEYLAPGWWTTPTREAMNAFLANGGDDAPQLRLNSMQVAQARHRVPVALVSELPQYCIEALSDQAPSNLTRAEVDERCGRALAETAEELAAICEHQAEHRLAQARGLLANAASWGDREANVGYALAGRLSVYRARVANEAAALQLDRERGQRPTPIRVQRFRERVDELVRRFEPQPWTLGEQVRAQLVMVQRLVEYLVREQA